LRSSEGGDGERLPFIRKAGWRKYPKGIFDLTAVHQKHQPGKPPVGNLLPEPPSKIRTTRRYPTEIFDKTAFHQKGWLEKNPKDSST
jgi:hypothetical protein